MPAASHLIPSPARNRAPQKKQKKQRVASTTFRTLRVSVSLMAQSTSLRESLGWPNQRGSKTSQACYSHTRCNLNLVRLFRVSLLLPLIGRILFFPHPRGHKPTTPFLYGVVPCPRVECGVQFESNRRCENEKVVSPDKIRGGRALVNYWYRFCNRGTVLLFSKKNLNSSRPSDYPPI